MGPPLRDDKGWAAGGLFVAISGVKLEGVGAGANFAKGLPGGNIDVGWADGFIFAKIFLDPSCVELVETLKVVEGVVVCIVIFGKGFDAALSDVVDDPNENSVEANVGALIDPNVSLPLAVGCGKLDIPTLMPFYI